MSAGLVAFGVLAMCALVPGVGLVAGGIATLRRNSRIPQGRVPVEAVCVGRTFMSRPSRITLDHPVPGGWRRVTLVEGLPTSGVTGGVAQPGDRVVLWADPQRPQDVRLSPASAAGGVGGVLLLLMGLFLCGGALVFAVIGVAASSR